VKIAILGGTFDPPHKSHLELLRLAMQGAGCETSLLVPAGSHAFKSAGTDKTHRYRMAEIAAKSLEGCLACDVETSREGICYTVDTLKRLGEIWPGAEFTFAIGSDVLFQMHLWKDFAGLSALTRFACVLREGDSLENALPAAEKLSHNFHSRIALLEGSVPKGISSTALRKDPAQGAADLPDGVLAYIQEHRLYSQMA
jgi:nicotinate-nucleotide adenylyltransferase